MGHQPTRAHRPETRYEHLRANYVCGNITIGEFELEVGWLLRNDRMDETYPIRIGPPPPPVLRISDARRSPPDPLCRVWG